MVNSHNFHQNGDDQQHTPLEQGLVVLSWIRPLVADAHVVAPNNQQSKANYNKLLKIHEMKAYFSCFDMLAANKQIGVTDGTKDKCLCEESPI